MHEPKDPIMAYCQFCKEKREMSADYIIRAGTVRTLRGKCKTCQRPMQLVVKKNFELP